MLFDLCDGPRSVGAVSNLDTIWSFEEFCTRCMIVNSMIQRDRTDEK